MISLPEKSLVSKLYFDPTFNMQTAKVLPGEYFFTTENVAMVTLLGSCVSACIRDRSTGIGGMNHFMLPDRSEADSPVSASMRYGTHAMEVLINELLKAGAVRANLEAKVFGGAAVLRGLTAINVGERNASFVLQFLRSEQIPVISQDLNGTDARKVCFMPKTGKVWLRKLKRNKAPHALLQEKDYARKLEITQVAGGVELF